MIIVTSVEESAFRLSLFGDQTVLLPSNTSSPSDVEVEIMAWTTGRSGNEWAIAWTFVFLGSWMRAFER